VGSVEKRLYQDETKRDIKRLKAQIFRIHFSDFFMKKVD